MDADINITKEKGCTHGPSHNCHQVEMTFDNGHVLRIHVNGIENARSLRNFLKQTAVLVEVVEGN